MKQETNLAKKQIITFLTLTSLISAGLFIWIFNGAGDSLAAVLPMMYTPGIAAILTALIFKEKMKVLGWRLGKIRYVLYGYSLPIVVSLIGYGIVWLSKYAGFTTEQVEHIKYAKMIGLDLPVPFIVGLLSKMILGTLITILFVFGEELGWSGYLTPKLRKVYSLPKTSLIVGIYWAVWHYPAIIGGFYGTGTPLYISLPGFTFVLVGASFIRTVLVEKSNSLWGGVILHASHNIILMGLFLQMTVDNGIIDVDYLVSETGLFLGVVYIGVAIAFWKWQEHKGFFKKSTML
jgi:membrane protease YdiL (CAAX protease family)